MINIYLEYIENSKSLPVFSGNLEMVQGYAQSQWLSDSQWAGSGDYHIYYFFDDPNGSLLYT